MDGPRCQTPIRLLSLAFSCSIHPSIHPSVLTIHPPRIFYSGILSWHELWKFQLNFNLASTTFMHFLKKIMHVCRCKGCDFAVSKIAQWFKRIFESSIIRTYLYHQSSELSSIHYFSKLLKKDQTRGIILKRNFISIIKYQFIHFNALYAVCVCVSVYTVYIIVF